MSHQADVGAPAGRAVGAGGAVAPEAYTHGYSAPVVQHMASRSAAEQAGFFLPHLRAGMRLLDVGCGPGTITLGLAAAIAPGEVVGVDRELAMVEQARARAAEQGVATARFQVGDAYALPFPDAAFDAAFAHTVLEHLRDPVAALRELRRVLRPGAVLGVRDADVGSRLFAPPDPLVQQAFALYARLWAHNGGDPSLGRRLRAVLGAAGFGRTAPSASVTDWGTRDPTEFATGLAAAADGRWLAFAEEVVALGWTDREALGAMSAALRAWGARPDAFTTSLMCEVVAWVE